MENPIGIEIVLLPGAKMPENRQPDAGYDLFALEPVTIKPFERKIVRTGVFMNIPNGYYGRIAPRSGLAVKNGIDVMAGVIDSEYISEIGVVLVNLAIPEFLAQQKGAFSEIFGTAGTFTIRSGDKIAQIIFEKYHNVCWKKVGKLPETVRGCGAYGSTDEKQKQLT